MKFINKLCKLSLIIIVATLLVVINVSFKKVEAATYQQKVQEYRAAWVSCFAGDFPKYESEEQYKKEFNQVLDNLEKWGFNAIVFHVRTHNNALYKSDLNPLASWWSKVNFDVFDPLAWSIDACHERGIEFHAWMNPYRITTSGSYPAYSNETSYPVGNPANDPDNLIIVEENIILDPGIPENRDFIVDTCMEVIENYDVDAIHFDDYFYIENTDDTKTQEKYNTNNLSEADFRRHQVDLFIEQLHNEVTAFNKANNKAVEIGISPSGVYRNGSYPAGTKPSYNESGDLIYPVESNTGGFAHYGKYLYSDTKYWIDQEWIDYITPQTYHAIGNQYSSFSKLTEWWNWVVEHKKVNLSMGVGIYMAITNSGGWTSSNELYNQMLNANSKENISGLCFYKYGSLLSSNANIVSHVNALKSFWTKKIPSAVKQQHTDLPEILVSNVNLNNTTLSWDQIDGVRGYVVWKVTKGTEVDTTNINHLYDYVQSNQIEVEEGFDYYVSSVNLANEISNPVSSNSLSEVEIITNKISSIKFPVTLNDEANINEIAQRYNNLKEDLKPLVSNYELLVVALSQIEILKEIELDAQEFLKTLKNDVLDKYLLPLTYKDYQINWDYQNATDSSLYEIQTGKVKVEFLATTYVNLIGTLSKDGVSHTFDYKLNVGYTKTNETGLFYRNTPNAMNKLEDTNANASFIGWCGHVMKFTVNNINYVFFPAVGNCFELTSSDIPTPNFTSCGNLYHNATNQEISGKGSQFVVNTTTNYGYFIIGSNGLVRVSVSQVTDAETITLNPGEYLYCVKYLDSQINGSVMKPATNIPVGTKVEVLEAVWSDGFTNEEIAQEIIDQINLITTPITLNQKELILRAKNLYDNAIEEVKLLVSNYNVLEDAINKINELEQAELELNNSKNNAKNEIKNYISDLSIYSTNNQNNINSLIIIFNSKVNLANSINEINNLVSEYKIKLDAVKTIVEEDAEKIVEYRLEAIKKVEAFYSINDYTLENQEKINNIVNEFKTLIETINTINEVDILTINYQNKIAVIPSIYETVLQLSKERLNEVNASTNLNLYYPARQTEVKRLVAQAKAKLLSALTVDEINKIMSDFENSLSLIPTIEEEKVELNEAQNKYANLLETNYDLSLYTKQDQILMQAIIDEYKEKIYAETSKDQVLVLYQDACSELSEFRRDELQVLKNNALKDAQNYAQNSGIESTNKDLEILLANLEQDLKGTKSSNEIDNLLNNFKTACDNLKKTIDNNNNNNKVSCMAAYYISSVILAMSLAFIAIFRKRS